MTLQYELSLYIYIYIYVFSPLTHSFSQLTHSTHSPYSYPIYSPIILSKHSLTQYRYSISLNLHYQSFLIISLPTYSRRSLIQITLIHLAPNSLSLLSLSHPVFSVIQHLQQPTFSVIQYSLAPHSFPPFSLPSHTLYQPLYSTHLLFSTLSNQSFSILPYFLIPLNLPLSYPVDSLHSIFPLFNPTLSTHTLTLPTLSLPTH